MKPAALRAGVILAVACGVIGLVAAGIALARAGHNADVFVRKHPDQSHAVGLAGHTSLPAWPLGWPASTSSAHGS